MAQLSPEEKLLSGELWNEFCDALKQAGSQVLAAGVPTDPLSQAEGYRYLTRLLRLSLEKQVEFSDPQYPQFYSLSHETAKIGNDNPDNFYQNCAIDGRHEYRIRGHRGSVDYLSIETKAGSYAGGGEMAPTGHVELEELDIGSDGYFELIVSAKEHPGNWLPMTEASDSLLVRQTFRDRSKEQVAKLSIECLDPQDSPVLDPAKFAQQLETVVPFVSGTAGLFHQWMQSFSEHINQLPPNDQEVCLRAGGDPAIYYHNSYWELEADQALVVEFTPPKECRTWNLQLSNYWMESLDYRYHRIHINKHSAVLADDGTVCIVISGQNPGTSYPNWLDTAGHRCGAMLLRYVEASDKPPIRCRVVKLSDLQQ
ncbi:DUF1214 domain-containing protein [Parahaliea sp. F7430]|uniref:DUF1214 domain-containing protein n=1 Tax=Sediminihaliea albiluteola TaxID=2758564 RepID=A0A7W2TVV1_9GAMM|nr:DUF1214 domain-containing protein [Sediminihaliea albiluteola]MBA6412920.1 DUF1214 domain-containing protein [Sediminihaliea albiluteola]